MYLVRLHLTILLNHVAAAVFWRRFVGSWGGGILPQAYLEFQST